MGSRNKGRVVWGFDGRTHYGSIEEKTVTNDGDYEVFRNRVGEVHEIRVYDKRKSISLTATVTDDVDDEDIPEVGDRFTAPYGRHMRETEFVCTGSSLSSRNEDTATLRLSGRMVPGHTPSAHRDEQGLPQAAEQATT